ncbi:hypothetical protein NliqN6_0149 [Naganishia liquefaciens]|uniref:50S ribosomal protein L17 n=1 Tax=Naganishia liquefaciens TaxID=104408 RepID=A0A8H3TMC9_9TREE|nr:hypothetical protein NliqN6_0149 [Naganishia liquefaciens]
MKHGIKLRKLGRTSSHRSALLRNLVAALLHHEQIQTTVPKAKEAARVAEKMITLGKKGTETAKRSAQAMLMPAHHYGVSSTPLPQMPISPSSGASSSTSSSSGDSTSLLPKLFGTLAQRYASRPGGYTRVIKYGRRPGDNAEQCLLSLVDAERDVKAEMTARAVGREVVERVVGSGKGVEGLVEGVRDGLRAGQGLSERTWREVEKVVRFRTPREVEAFEGTAMRYANELWAMPIAAKNARTALDSRSISKNRTPPSSANATKPTTLARAGTRAPGSSVAGTGLGIARGLLGARGAGAGAGAGPRAVV